MTRMPGLEHIARLVRRLVVVVDSAASVPASFATIRIDADLHDAHRAAAHALRVAAYAADGVTPDTPTASQWDLLMTDEAGAPVGSIWVQNEGSLARIGGWAVAQVRRSSAVGLVLALAAGHVVGALGYRRAYALATARHGSAHLLRRIGGVDVAQYFDATYNCEMHRIEFSRSFVENPHPFAAPIIGHLQSVPVIARVY